MTPANRSTRTPHVRPGFTLIELTVVVAVLSVMAAVVGVALRAPREVPNADAAWRRTVATARARALATGRPVHVPPAADAHASRELTALPDGSVVAAPGDPAAGDSAAATGAPRPVDRLTGHVVDFPPTGPAAP